MKAYSKICPGAGCDKRYGKPNPDGFIDIELCAPCAEKRKADKTRYYRKGVSDTVPLEANSPL